MGFALGRITVNVVAADARKAAAAKSGDIEPMNLEGKAVASHTHSKRFAN